MAFIPRPRCKRKLSPIRVFTTAWLIALIVIGALSSVTSQALDSRIQEANHAAPSTLPQGVKLSLNRYQAGFVCRENGWEFCAKWAYPRGLLA